MPALWRHGTTQHSPVLSCASKENSRMRVKSFRSSRGDKQQHRQNRLDTPIGQKACPDRLRHKKNPPAKRILHRPSPSAWREKYELTKPCQRSDLTLKPDEEPKQQHTAVQYAVIEVPDISKQFISILRILCKELQCGCKMLTSCVTWGPGWGPRFAV